MGRHKSDRPKKDRATHDEPAEKYDAEAEDAPPSWLSRASERFEQRQQGYASLFAGAKEAVEKDKQRLSTFLDKTRVDDDEEEAPPPPPIFDEAARAYEERQKSLGGLFSDAVKAKQQEREALSKMFGERPAKKPPRR